MDDQIQQSVVETPEIENNVVETPKNEVETPKIEVKPTEKEAPKSIKEHIQAVKKENEAKKVDNSGVKDPEKALEKPAWTPNYKVKAYDSEYDIPENFRQFINEKNEADFRKLFEKSFATETVLQKNQKIRETNTQYEKAIKEKYEPLERGVQMASKYLERGDYDSLFDLLKIPEKNLQAWMLQKLKMRDLPPEERALYDSHSASQKKLYELEQQTETYRQTLEQIQATQEQQAIAARHNEMDQILNRPEIKAIVDSFDARLGQAGAFKTEVIQRAAFTAQTKGLDLSAEQAVQEFLKLLPPTTATQAVSPADRVVVANDKKPTLPNVAGKTTSPAAQKVMSLDDLKKLRAQSIKSMQTS